METDFDKCCLVGRRSPTIVPFPMNRKKPASSKSSEMSEFQKNIGSIKEVGPPHKTEPLVERKKIELSQGNMPGFSFEIIDSLCSSDEDRPIMSPLGKGTSVFSYHVNESKETQKRDKVAISHKSRFKPFKKMFGPFVRSKSRRSPLSNSDKIINRLAGFNHDNLSDKPCRVDYNYYICEEKENHSSAVQPTAGLLHGLLKLGKRHGDPFFEFSVKSTEDFYFAKIKRVEKGPTWIYTFHSLHKGGKSSNNASPWGALKDGNRALSNMVGQMHVSCNRCENSITKEFVLYDMTRSRSTNYDCLLSWGNCEWNQAPAEKTIRDEIENSCENARFPADLEIAAIVVQVPLGKAEEGIFGILGPAETHVVVPSGVHGLPVRSKSGGGPSRLVDQWNSGGGCDCGGWDMACPLDVFSSSKVRAADLADDRWPAQLIFQGKKDNLPAFTMKVIGDGKYTVDFHARLSSLQAFSICVAILHATEASRRETSVCQMAQSDSLMILYAREDTGNTKDSKAEDGDWEDEEIMSSDGKMEQFELPSFVVNLPFSPVARV